MANFAGTCTSDNKGLLLLLLSASFAYLSNIKLSYGAFLCRILSLATTHLQLSNNLIYLFNSR